MAQGTITTRPDSKIHWVVITGGPGAGKTAVVELVRRTFSKYVRVVPEAASLVFSGGFPRVEHDAGLRAAQRAIFHVQRELEHIIEAEATHPVAICDRGTVDGVAYWPAEPDALWSDVGTTAGDELAMYDTVIHMRSAPPAAYNHDNPIRLESPEEAAAIDARIEAAWANHPRRYFVGSHLEFAPKAMQALSLVWGEIPPEIRPESPFAFANVAE